MGLRVLFFCFLVSFILCFSYGNSKISSAVILEKAIQENKYMISLGSKCFSLPEKMAWLDCIDLYNSTILLINKIITNDSNIFDFHTQIWLSTVLTNLDICRSGFIKLNLTNNIFRLLPSNLSNLIYNILIENKISKAKIALNELPTLLKSNDLKFFDIDSFTFQPNIIVSKDGKGHYKTITEAINEAARKHSGKRYVIRIRSGIYEEYIEIGRNLNNIVMVGDDIRKTIITGSRSVKGGYKTFNSATFAVNGFGFVARDITFQNTAGPKNLQAVALRSDSHHSVFYRCSFEGYQDTLYIHSMIHFFRECEVYGTIDFICGNGQMVMQNSNIYVRDTSTAIVTAQSQDSKRSTGFIFQNCKVMAAPGSTKRYGNTYLGRPWRRFSKVVFMTTYLDDIVNSQGWTPWNGKDYSDSLYYGEYKNTGPGSSTKKRIKWKGFHAITSPSEASQFTVRHFIHGDAWLPASKVPFLPDL